MFEYEDDFFSTKMFYRNQTIEDKLLKKDKIELKTSGKSEVELVKEESSLIYYNGIKKPFSRGSFLVFRAS